MFSLKLERKSTWFGKLYVPRPHTAHTIVFVICPVHRKCEFGCLEWSFGRHFEVHVFWRSLDNFLWLLKVLGRKHTFFDSLLKFRWVWGPPLGARFKSTWSRGGKMYILGGTQRTSCWSTRLELYPITSLQDHRLRLRKALKLQDRRDSEGVWDWKTWSSQPGGPKVVGRLATSPHYSI